MNILNFNKNTLYFHSLEFNLEIKWLFNVRIFTITSSYKILYDLLISGTWYLYKFLIENPPLFYYYIKN